MNSSPSVSISIVSHGHRQHLIPLLRDITQSIDVPYEIFLTMNIAEDSSFLEEFKNSPIYLLINPDPKGFGANHNSAFSRSRAPYFVVLNPDMRGYPFRIQPLLDNFSTGNIAATAPLILNSNGIVQESIRKFPTPFSLLARKLKVKARSPAPFNQPQVIDWAAGMFLVFTRHAYEQLGGFDERYFMYVEDVDICWRIHKAGLEVRVVPECCFIHEGQYQSRRNLQHFLWHLKSFALFFAKFYGFIEAGTSPKRF